MNLAQYVDNLRGRTSYRNAGAKIGISGGSLHKIAIGSVQKPSPRTLVKIAQYYGESEADQQKIYATLMKLAGYLDLMPRAVLHFTDLPPTPSSPVPEKIMEMMNRISKLPKDKQKKLNQILKLHLELIQ